MADVIREAIIKIGLEQIPGELKAPDLTKAVTQQREYTEGVRKTKIEASEATIALEKKSEAIAGAIAKTEEHRKLLELSAQASLKYYKAQVQAAEGVLALGRGFALLAASGDEDLQKVVQSIAAVQGGIDLFKGSVAIIDAVAKAQKAAMTASVLATEAELALAAANEFRAAASMKAAAASVALTVATLPLSTLLIGVTAALAAGAALWALWGDEGESALERQTRLLGEQKDLMGSLNSVLEKQIAFRRTLRELDEKAEGARLYGDNVGLLEARRKRAEQSLSFDDATDIANRVNTESFRGNLGPQAANIILSDTKSKIEDSVASYEKYADQVEKVRDTELERIRNMETLTNQQQRQLEQAQKQLEIEQKRQLSFKANTGSLDAGSRAELERLLSIIEGGGKLNQQQTKRFGELSGQQGAEFTQRSFAQFDNGLADRLGKAIGDSLSSRQQEVENAAAREEAKLSDLTGGLKIEEFLKKLASERKAIEENAESTLKQVNTVLERLFTVMKRFEIRQDEFERDINSIE